MAKVKVRIPTPLQKLTGGKGEVECEGVTIREMFAALEKSYPGVKERLYDEEGKLRRFINIYVNEEDIRFLDGEDTSLSEGDDVSVIPAIAGGGA
ncbi:MAG: MoaD/ThiS family protein [Candidatus Nitrospinota bacterium M3_3B_026]